MHLIDDEGDRYLDLLSGIGVNALGYAHPAIENAIAEQSRKLIHISNLYFHEGQAELAVRLNGEHRARSRVFLQQRDRGMGSCAEAGAAYAGITARAKASKIGTKFLALEHSFHGRTMGSVATTA